MGGGAKSAKQTADGHPGHSDHVRVTQSSRQGTRVAEAALCLRVSVIERALKSQRSLLSHDMQWPTENLQIITTGSGIVFVCNSPIALIQNIGQHANDLTTKKKTKVELYQVFCDKMF